MSRRVEGYKQALLDANLDTSDELLKILPFSHEKDDVFEAVKELVSREKDQIDAIFFTTSKVGVMGLECIHSLNVKIPDDVAVVSFDDPDAYKICQPPISAIAQPLKEIGSQAVNVLLGLMNNQKNKPATQNIILKTNFIARKSSIG
jgi:LacI family transcriptional regulator